MMNLQLPEGSKFACVLALAQPMGDVPERMDFGDLLFTRGMPFGLSDWWKETLGWVSFEAMRHVNSCFTLHQLAEKPAILDDENKVLVARVQTVFHCLLLSGIPQVNTWTVLSGDWIGGRVELRSHGDGDRFFGAPGTSPKPVTKASVEAAATAFNTLDRIYTLQNEYARLKRGFHALVVAIREYEPDFKFHQYIRAIEALLGPGRATSQRFADVAIELAGLLRREATRDEFKLMYDIRCAAEHLNEMTDPLRSLDETKRIAKVHECIRTAEALALASYLRVLTVPGLATHFNDPRSIKALWSAGDDKKRLAFRGEYARPQPS